MAARAQSQDALVVPNQIPRRAASPGPDPKSVAVGSCPSRKRPPRPSDAAERRYPRLALRRLLLLLLLRLLGPSSVRAVKAVGADASAGRSTSTAWWLLRLLRRGGGEQDCILSHFSLWPITIARYIHTEAVRDTRAHSI